MSRPAFLIVAALTSLAACGDKSAEPTKADREVKVDITRADDKADSKVVIEADTDTGKFELKLPGGIAAKVDLPAGIESLGGDHAKFDIDGVGLFPGAKVRSFNIRASDSDKTKSAVVKIGFNAPGDAAAVADWYQAQFDAKRKPVTRRGETISGTTDDGDAFTIALDPAGAGAAKGLLTITDTKAS